MADSETSTTYRLPLVGMADTHVHVRTVPTRVANQAVNYSDDPLPNNNTFLYYPLHDAI